MGDTSGATSGSPVGSMARAGAGDGVPDMAVDNRRLARLSPQFRRLCDEVAAIEAAHAITHARGFVSTYDALAVLRTERKFLADLLEGTSLAREGGSNAEAPISVPPDEHPEKREAADREAVKRAQITLKLGDKVICREEGEIKDVVSARESLRYMLTHDHVKEPDVRADVMDCIVLLTRYIGDKRYLECLACRGFRAPYIHPNNPTRNFERCPSCGGAGEIDVDE